MSKILLINPKFQKTIYSPLPDPIERSRGKYPPLGLAYLAGSLKQHNYEVQIYDADLEDRDYRGLIQKLKKEQPKIIGITTTSFTFLQAKLTARIVRKILPNSRILVGGPHVSIYPREVLSNEEFDIGILGEGEETIIDLVKGLENSKDLKTIPGIAYQKNGTFFQTEFRPLIQNLDEIPFPARSLLQNRKYFYPFAKRNPFTTVITSRGCPFNCAFCLRASGIHFGRKYRTRSPQNIIRELEEIINYFQIREIFFYDDIFTLNQVRIWNLCKEIIKRQLDIIWNCRTRVDTVTPKLLKIMKRAGCERIHYGIESGDPLILKNLRKNISISQIEKAFLWTKQNEIEAFAYIMLGAPGETFYSIRKTMQLLKKIKPDYVGFFITTLFPGTDLYKDALEKGSLKNEVWKEFTRGTLKVQPLPFIEENYSKVELQKILKKCYQEYYFRPYFFWQKLKSLRSIGQLKINFRGFCLLLQI
ncbi:MAG: B12-binding domain-containing radical SAM protein [Candidatus Helarchaeota archaeon]